MKPKFHNHSYSVYFKAILNTASKMGFEIISYGPYPDKQDLQTLLIYNRALLNSEKAFIHLSGLHGVEGAVGAEIQLQLLKTHGVNLLQSSQGFLMIFAVNPFGFHFLRRTSIENIDLNRNTGDGINPVVLTPAHHRLRPLWKSHTVAEQARGFLQSMAVGLRKGFPALLRLFAEGQSCEPEGLFYSGTKTSIEVKELFHQLQPLLQNKRYLYAIDVHSGLGKLYGELLFLNSGDRSKTQPILTHPVDCPGEKPNSYRGQGLLSDRFMQAFPNAQLFYVVQEFGVKSTVHSFFSLIKENQYHWNHYGQISDKLYLKHPIKDAFFQTYFSTESEWQSWLGTTGTNRFMELFSTGTDTLLGLGAQ